MSIFSSEIAPKGLQFNPGDFVISDKYATILTVVSYPRYIDHGYLANLTNNLDVSLSYDTSKLEVHESSNKKVSYKRNFIFLIRQHHLY